MGVSHILGMGGEGVTLVRGSQTWGWGSQMSAQGRRSQTLVWGKGSQMSVCGGGWGHQHGGEGFIEVGVRDRVIDVRGGGHRDREGGRGASYCLTGRVEGLVEILPSAGTCFCQDPKPCRVLASCRVFVEIK